PAMATLASHWHGVVAYALHGFVTVPFWLMVAGLVVAWYCYIVHPALPPKLYRAFSGINRILEYKYYADWFNEQVIARGARSLGHGSPQGGHRSWIGGREFNGRARVVGWVAAVSRHLQCGYIYHYAFAMIIGFMALLTFCVLTVH